MIHAHTTDKIDRRTVYTDLNRSFTSAGVLLFLTISHRDRPPNNDQKPWADGYTVSDIRLLRVLFLFFCISRVCKIRRDNITIVISGRSWPYTRIRVHNLFRQCVDVLRRIRLWFFFSNFQTRMCYKIKYIIKWNGAKL